MVDLFFYVCPGRGHAVEYIEICKWSELRDSNPRGLRSCSQSRPDTRLRSKLRMAVNVRLVLGFQDRSSPPDVTARCKSQGSLPHGLAVSSELTRLLHGVPLRAPVGFEPTTPGCITEGTVRPSPARCRNAKYDWRPLELRSCPDGLFVKRMPGSVSA